jgi:hypothetical protein
VSAPTDPTPRAHAHLVADRFRGEEAANVVRAGIAFVFLVTGAPYTALLLATVVLGMAVVLRAGRSAPWMSFVLVALDAEALVFLVADPSVPVMVGAACIAVVLAALRFDARLVVTSAVLAWCALRAQILQRAILAHGGPLPPTELTTEQHAWFLLPAVVAAIAVAGIVVRQKRRVTSESRSAGALPLDEQAGYREPAVGAASGIPVCASCHAPVLEKTDRCWLCAASVAGERAIDASHVAARIFDPRIGRRRSIATAMLASGTALGAFVALGSRESLVAVVTPAMFVLAALLPLVSYLPSAASRRGEMLRVNGVARPIGAVLVVVLALSSAVLAMAALFVLVGAICTAAGFPLR